MAYNILTEHTRLYSGGEMDTAKLEPLLVKAQGGDRAALVELLEEVGPEVRRRIAAKITPSWRSVLDEDDVMQVTYLEAVLRLDSFSTGGVSGFLAWLSRLAENNLIDAIRALESAKRPNPRKRVRAGPGQESMVALVEILGVASTTPSRDAARGEAIGMMDKAIEALPRDYGTVIRMYDLECRPVAEVAETMGRSEGAVFMLRARAHDRLRELMGPDSKFFTKQG